MKAHRFLLFALCLIPLVFFTPMPTKADPLDTIQFEWVLVRAEGDEDAATAAACLDLTTKGDFANRSTTAFDITPKPDGSGSMTNMGIFAFCGDNTADENFNVVAYGYANKNGPAEFLFDVQCTLGTQAVVKYPHSGATATGILWANTVALSSGVTDEAPSKIDIIDSGNNRICRVKLDLTGLRYVKCYVYNANDATTEAGEVSVYMRRY